MAALRRLRPSAAQ